MDRFQRFNNRAGVAVASLAAAAALVITDATSAFFKSRLIGGAAAVVLVSILALVGSTLLESAVDRSRRIRRWIAQDDFVEGWWLDVAKDPASGLSTHAALQQVSYREGAFVVSGSSYLRGGERLASWSSEACAYVHRTLFVVYEAQTAEVGGLYERGLVEMKFDTPPTSYSGSYRDFSGQVIRSLRGERISDRELLEHNGLQTVADRISLLRSRVPEFRSAPE
jgi:hypothetical protein